MAKFKYVATTPEGVTVTGTIESPTTIGARDAIAEKALSIVSLREKSGANIQLTKKKVPREAIMHFSRQLAAFIRAGIPILEAIDVLGQEVDNVTFKRVLLEMADALRRGDQISAAVAEHGKVFPRFYVDMLKAAELTGKLDSVLDQVASYIERDLDARRKIRSAMTYPAMIGVMSLVTVGILTVFVLPRFEVFFKSLDAELPLPTRMVLGAAGFLGTWWWAVAGGAAIFGVLLILGLRTGRGRAIRDALLLKVPVIRDVVKFAIVERFCRILSSMLDAGVPLPDALIVVTESTRNAVYEKALVRVREDIMEGDGIATPIARAQLFPPTVLQMVRVGENTGTLDQQLHVAAGYYEQELDYKIKKLTALFEPAMIVFMGLVVGFVAVALVSAMYGVFRQAGTLG
jgi:type IV pilus assembly protein PilC